MERVGTAGRIVQEDELRVYTQCSQLWHYGADPVLDPQFRISMYCYERIIAHYIRKSEWDPMALMTRFLFKAVYEYGYDRKYLEQQVQQMVRRSIIWLNDVLNMFPPDKYIPIYGPFQYRIRIGKTPIQLHVSALYRSIRNQTLHIVCLTPYKTRHAALNDPTIHLKLQTLKRVVKQHNSGRAQAKVHLFGLGAESNLLYFSLDTESVDKQQLALVEGLVSVMESGIHYPVVPCLAACPFKKKCTPTGG